MVFPDYKNSIVNVSSSIIAALGGETIYPPLEKLSFLRDHKKIVLLVFDGLGYEFLKRYGNNSFLWKNCASKITSVFPSTTATAETSLETGVAPQQHAITGWLMLIKELGLVSKALLFEPRAGGSLFKMGVKWDSIYTEKLIIDRISSPSMFVMPRIAAARFNGSSRVAVFDDLAGMIDRIKKAIAKKNNRFVFAYWIDFDKISHKKGCAGSEAIEHFLEVDKKIEGLSNFIKKENACLLVTADHGFCDIPEENRLVLQDYKEIYDCLSLPLCGESRAAFCYVRPEKDAKFRRLVKKDLDFCCTMFKSSDLIKKGVFGLGEPNPRLYERVGDHILAAKDGFNMRDLLAHESKPEMTGFHGGMSELEMYVPLVVFH